MTISRCLTQAQAIAANPVSEWKRLIAELPTECAHDDCSKPRNCQKTTREWLEMQYKIRRVKGDSHNR